MPRMKPQQIQNRKKKIESAAIKCFLQSGFNGVSVRDIAEAADVSTGNLYNHYQKKEDLFASIYVDLSKDFLAAENPIFLYTQQSRFPFDLEELAKAVEENVLRYRPFFKMTYIDVVEFKGQHSGGVFSNVYGKFQLLMAKRFSEIKDQWKSKEVDPAFSFVAMYLQFYYHFALKHVFSAKDVYGPFSDNEVVSKMISLHTHGINSFIGREQ